jgi:hypothetical protein
VTDVLHVLITLAVFGLLTVLVGVLDRTDQRTDRRTSPDPAPDPAPADGTR